MKPAYLQSKALVKHGQNLCFLCERNNSPIYYLNGKYLCESCIDITHSLIINRIIQPTSDIESALFSLLFVLEKEMRFTRETLNKTGELSAMQEILKTKIEMIDAFPRKFEGVNEALTNKYLDLINQYKTLLTLFLS